ncbi:2-aminoethanethiol dioxygenase-like [Sycon ciliatum]|uniref:2-aminoethanethiol dioxygenase-like n=1 Tax=Sycon ciliatum TaxID=27933 RepID=UPI0020A9E543|eukprot:scpid99301/ scgid16151/ 2-aminoethanethiol dioxygenase; Cysteamine dioxygenase
MNSMQRLISQTVKRFSAGGEAHGLDGIRSAMCSLTPRDVGLLAGQPPIRRESCGYIGVDDSPFCTICIFVLKEGAKLPIHSHPAMTGLLKVLYGRVIINSYQAPCANKTLAIGQNIRATLDSVSTLTADNEPSIVTPTTANVHEIHALENSAFLDVLAPPYNDEDDRSCAYFRDISLGAMVAGAARTLEVIPPPRDFWTQPMEYEGLPLAP